MNMTEERIEERSAGLRIHWSDRMELLADGLWESWKQAQRHSGDPFGKICVVVNDAAAGDWLKQYLLLNRSAGSILMGLVVIPVAEFVNQWLFAQTHKDVSGGRHPALHPYAQPNMAWRIFDILEQEGNNPEFGPVLSYIDQGGRLASEQLASRRFAVSRRLAQLFDDYLNFRYRVLWNWECGNEEPLEKKHQDLLWQKSLYRKLIQLNPQSYAKDYALALDPQANPSDAFLRGFPRYTQIHLWDLSFLSEPVLGLLEKMSQAMPMFCWNFNPAGDWLGEGRSRKEEVQREWGKIRKKVREQRKNIQTSGWLPEYNLEYDTLWFRKSSSENTVMSEADIRERARENLLAAMASGVRAQLGAQCDWPGSGIEVLGTPGAMWDRLHASDFPVAVHDTVSPRRELEAIRDGLHDFFNRHPEAKPHDAVILCADWATYAPYVNLVFPSSPEVEGYIPVSLGGRLSRKSASGCAVKELFSFQTNRMEVGKVLHFLGYPAVRRRFQIEEEQLPALEKMVADSSVRWGADAVDAENWLKRAWSAGGITGKDSGGASPSFPESVRRCTWEQGLRQLTLDLFYGDPEPDEVLSTPLGNLVPVGYVEGKERISLLRALICCVEELAKFRRNFALGVSRTPKEWTELLLSALDSFFAPVGDEVGEFAAIRQGILNVDRQILVAQGAGSSLEKLEAALYLEAVSSEISADDSVSRKAAEDSVLFAPLNCSTATPHALVWICGLNDAAFPKMEYPVSFDLLRRTPSLFDVQRRERDSYALLKAMLSARAELALSYVGRNAVTDEKMPPSMLLKNLTDYFRETGRNFTLYEHPHLPYSRRYFLPRTKEAGSLPPVHFPSLEKIARSLAGNDAAAPASPPEGLTGISLEPDENGVVHLEAEGLASYLNHPWHVFHQNRLETIMSLKKKNVLAEDEPSALEKPSDEPMPSFENVSQWDEAQIAASARRLAARGLAPDEESAAKGLHDHVKRLNDVLDRVLSLGIMQEAGEDEEAGEETPDWANRLMGEWYDDWLNCGVEQEGTLEFLVQGRSVQLHHHWKMREFIPENRAADSSESFSSFSYQMLKNDYDVKNNWIFDFVLHLVTNALSPNGNWSVSLSETNSNVVHCEPLSKDLSMNVLQQLLEFVFSPVLPWVYDWKKVEYKEDSFRQVGELLLASVPHHCELEREKELPVTGR